MSPRYIFALAISGASLALLWYVFSQQNKPVTHAEHKQELADYAPRNWNNGHRGKLNISVFAFRDQNRNGRYDMGDTPQASLAIRLTRPDGKILLERSNTNGFTNFPMSLEDPHADISQAGGGYSFEVLVPDGWAVTTDNLRQSPGFSAMIGSVSGLVAEPPPTAVGLAPELTVSGQVAKTKRGDQPLHNSAINLVSVAPDGHRQKLALDEDGSFTFPGGPGTWFLEIETPALNETQSRSFQMKDVPVRLSSITPGEHRPEPLETLKKQDFEYLSHSSIGKIPGGESGLDWDNLIAVHNQLYHGPGYVNVLHSGKTVGYNGSGHPVTITSGETGQSFDFIGAYFGAAWPQAEGETLTLEAWRGESLAYHEQLSLSYLGSVWFQADYHDIDKLVLSSTHYWQFVTDDMEFRIADDS